MPELVCAPALTASNRANAHKARGRAVRFICLPREWTSVPKSARRQRCSLALSGERLVCATFYAWLNNDQLRNNEPSRNNRQSRNNQQSPNNEQSRSNEQSRFSPAAVTFPVSIPQSELSRSARCAKATASSASGKGGPDSSITTARRAPTI